jgi:ABC-type branched-subunit amino acid transport system ATPase component
MSPQPLLTVRALSKHFGGLTALDRFDLAVGAGERVGIIGPNGSGKTTLFNVLTGMTPADGGEVFIEGFGRNLLAEKTHDIVRRGIARTFQNQRPFNNLTVLENVMVGGHSRTRGGVFAALFGSSAARRDRLRVRAEAEAALAVFGDRLLSMAERPAWTLSYANRRRLEIARALVSRPRVLLVDEPTAGMNPAESLQLAQNILDINAGGVAVLMIEHDMGVIKKICQRVVALDQGEKIVEGSYTEVRHHPRVIEAYLGQD